MTAVGPKHPFESILKSCCLDSQLKIEILNSTTGSPFIRCSFKKNIPLSRASKAAFKHIFHKPGEEKVKR